VFAFFDSSFFLCKTPPIPGGVFMSRMDGMHAEAGAESARCPGWTVCTRRYWIVANDSAGSARYTKTYYFKCFSL